MKLASYMTDGKSAFGVVTGDGVITLNDRLRARHPTLRDALAGGALEEIRITAQSARPDRKLSEVRFLPAIPNPEKILCVGINYKSHAAEHGQEAPKLPNIFTRFVNTLVALEGELAVIIGRGGRHIAQENALDHVAGYTCFCDATVRDFTKYSLVASKNFAGTGPLGPWIVTAAEVPDPTALTLVTRLNGEEMQRWGTDMLIHSIPAIIAFC